MIFQRRRQVEAVDQHPTECAGDTTGGGKDLIRLIRRIGTGRRAEADIAPLEHGAAVDLQQAVRTGGIDIDLELRAGVEGDSTRGRHHFRGGGRIADQQVAKDVDAAHLAGT